MKIRGFSLTSRHALLVLLVIAALAFAQTTTSSAAPAPTAAGSGFTDAAAFGFSPEASGLDNAKALQRAVDRTGTIVVSKPGTYKISATVFIGSNTSLIFGNNVFLKKVNEAGMFSQVLLNKGALTKTYDQHIAIEGLQIIVNGIDSFKWNVYGLRGQLAFFYVKDLRIEHYRCLDIGSGQYGVHVCTFEDLIINDVVLKGKKDGVHLGRGKHFTVRNGIFETFDDAVALNAHDYASSNPELGWIEDGVVENCIDLNAARTTGYFSRILAGAWVDWRPGMEVQNSDTVVSEGRLYRVQAQADGKIYKSLTRPTHPSGAKVLDGINWGMVQTGAIYTAGVRNVVYRDIILEKARAAFSIHFDNDRFSRSYYPGAQIPRQENILFDNIRVLHDAPTAFLLVMTPVDVVTIVNSSLKNNVILFGYNKAMTDYFKTQVNLIGCTFGKAGKLDFLINRVPNKIITFKTTASTELSDQFSAAVVSGGGKITVESDLTGLKK